MAEFNFVGVIIDFLWILTLIVLAGIPGAAPFTFLDVKLLHRVHAEFDNSDPGLFVMHADRRAFYLLTKRSRQLQEQSAKLAHLCGNLIRVPGMMALSLAAIGSVFVTHEGAKPSFVYAAVAAAILSIVFSFAPALYLRFLGRLAWIIEDDVRKREELKLEKENEGDEDTDEE